jgi:hypothetical protein
MDLTEIRCGDAGWRDVAQIVINGGGLRAVKAVCATSYWCLFWVLGPLAVSVVNHASC